MDNLPLFDKMPSKTTTVVGEQETVQLEASISDHQFNLSYLNRLEGYKTKLKEMHWITAKTDKVLHEFVSEVAGVVDGYQDAIAENLQSFQGVIRVGTLNPTPCTACCVYDLLQNWLTDIKAFEGLYKNNMDYIGAININEGAATDCMRLIYLAQPYKQ